MRDMIPRENEPESINIRSDYPSRLDVNNCKDRNIAPLWEIIIASLVTYLLIDKGWIQAQTKVQIILSVVVYMFFIGRILHGFGQAIKKALDN